MLFMGPENPSPKRAAELLRLRTGSPVSTATAALATAGNWTGYDVSSNNTPDQLATALEADFVIIKASEGVSYKWDGGQAFAAKRRALGRPLSWYHYAHPENNGPDAEARAFMAAAKAQPGEGMWLDFEPPSIQPAYPAWTVSFCDLVETWTGAHDGIYTNQSQGQALIKLASPEQRTALWSRPLWKAYYQASVGDLMGWPDWTCWQKTSTPFDTNEFKGDAAKWRSLGIPEPQQPKEAAMRLIRVPATGAISAVTDYTFTPVPTMPRALALAKAYGTWLEVTQAEADEIKAQVEQNAKALPTAPAFPPVPTPADIAAEVWKPVRG